MKKKQPNQKMSLSHSNNNRKSISVYKKVYCKNNSNSYKVVYFKGFKFTVDKNNCLTKDFYLYFFRLIKNFNLKYRGSKLNSYNKFVLDINSSELINSYVEKLINGINNNNSKEHNANNYNSLDNDSKKYPLGSNIFTNGLMTKLKSLYGGYKIE